MLKIYDSLDAVPEPLRSEYKLVGGKYVPDLSDDHPVLVNNRTLLREKGEAETKASDLQKQLDSAGANTVPRGHVAVPKADHELIEAVKAEGFTKADEVKQAKLAIGELQTRKSADHLRAVAKELGYEPEAFVRLQGLPEFEIRDGADGKKTVVAKVKGESGNVTEKPAAEFVESSPDIAPFLPALKAESGGTRVHGTSATTGKSTGDKYENIRKEVKNKEANKQGTASDLHPIFKPAQQPAAS